MDRRHRNLPVVIGEGFTVNSAAVLSLEDTPLPSINFSETTSVPSASSRRLGTVLSADDSSAAIEALPQLSSQIIRLWNSRELNTLIHRVLLDTRDGKRQGFPHEVAKELMFLAKLNVLTRADEAAPLLGISLAEACHLIEKGDHAALGYSGPAIDIWGVGERAKDRPLAVPQASPGLRRDRRDRHDHQPTRQAPATSPTPAPLSPTLVEAPTIPDSVCLDLTTSRALRHVKPGAHQDDGDVMDRGFFRCITKELGDLKIPQLVLSDLGNARRCRWLPAAIAFAKERCRFPSVVLHADPLSAQEAQLVLAMTAGLDQLVLNLNLASGRWRAQAEILAESDPEYFRQQIRRLLRSRDEITAKTGHHCAISVIQINHKSVFHLSRTFQKLGKEAGLTPFRHVSDGRRTENAGNCHCWSPFIEAHIRTNGHLVACAQDHSGYSFTADLKATSFSEAWHGPIFRHLRQRVLRGDKPGRLCEICPHRAAGKTSRSAAPKPAGRSAIPSGH